MHGSTVGGTLTRRYLLPVGLRSIFRRFQFVLFVALLLKSTWTCHSINSVRDIASHSCSLALFPFWLEGFGTTTSCLMCCSWSRVPVRSTVWEEDVTHSDRVVDLMEGRVGWTTVMAHQCLPTSRVRQALDTEPAWYNSLPRRARYTNLKIAYSLIDAGT